MSLHIISHTIKTTRKAKKWTQVDIAEYSGVAINTIKKIEAGFIDEVGIKKVELILDLLELELSLRPKGRPLTLDELYEKN
jgi:transcriptional regulator with XRE-family HTH domain